MREPAQFTPEDRVRLKVGGAFTPDTFDLATYRAINQAVLDDPDAHLDAFERLFLSPRPSRRAITELHLPDFLRGLQHLRPERVQSLAQRLGQLMASLARKQAGEAESAAEASDTVVDEIARQRRQLARRQEGIAALLGAR
jgi:hypothetical protein